jgi:hypothetical protein
LLLRSVLRFTSGLSHFLNLRSFINAVACSLGSEGLGEQSKYEYSQDYELKGELSNMEVLKVKFGLLSGWVKSHGVEVQHIHNSEADGRDEGEESGAEETQEGGNGHHSKEELEGVEGVVDKLLDGRVLEVDKSAELIYFVFELVG